jgi:light-regulated signal transduction histidine kinase (bacteriophytochrome)
MLQRIEARRLPAPNSSIKNPASLVSGSSTDLLKLVDADFALLSIEEQVRAIGRMEPYQEALAIMSYLQSCRFTGVRSSHNIKADFPGLSYPPGINTLAGLVVIPLNVGEGNNFLVFFRRAQIKHVKWAGYVEIHS